MRNETERLPAADEHDRTDAPTPTPRSAGSHVHTRRCWWDFREARWTCDLGRAVAALADD